MAPCDLTRKTSVNWMLHEESEKNKKKKEKNQTEVKRKEKKNVTRSAVNFVAQSDSIYARFFSSNYIGEILKLLNIVLILDHLSNSRWEEAARELILIKKVARPLFHLKKISPNWSSPFWQIIIVPMWLLLERKMAPARIMEVETEI